MKWGAHIWIYHVSIVLCALWGATAALDNPYKILGIHKRASQQEIRKAYKQLVKEWHPDKSNDPNAEERFVEIKQAYEIVSDPEKRRRYDNYGITEDDFYNKPSFAPLHTNHPFEDLFAQHGAHFNFQMNDITFFHKLSITTRQYDKTILPKSRRAPYLIFFYTDWCFQCIQTAPYCRKLIDYLEPLGVNFVTVHSTREPKLGKRLSIHSIPCLVLLLDGDIFVYKETVTSIQRIIEFVRNKLPYKMVTAVNEGNVEQFLNGWEDNRIRGLVFQPMNTIRLRYLITAYYFRHTVAFGFVDSHELKVKYQVPHDMDTVLLFNENTSYPMASVSMKDIPTPTLHQVISANNYLILPRLSSQEILESLCPEEWNKLKKKLCVVLVLSSPSVYHPYRDSYKNFLQQSPYKAEKARFVYIYYDKQKEFVDSLVPKGEIIQPLLKIVIIWRRDASQVMYEWLPGKWNTGKNFTETTSALGKVLNRLMKSSESLPNEAFVKDLIDENDKGILGRLYVKVFQFVEKTYDGMTTDQILAILSILGTILFIVGIGYFMAYLVRIEEENIQKQKAKSSNNNNNGINSKYQPELQIHEFRSETFNALVRLLKPGCRTIVLILDMESRQQLIPPFHKAVWPYRKNKTLMFAYMYVERGLKWYKEVLQLSLPFKKEFNINPRNCVGTVLSINGHRKYYCIYHFKHTEKKKKIKEPVEPLPLSEVDCESGAFIGFDSDSSESDDGVQFQGALLNGFSNWLDRLFEGTTQRFRINYWPEFPIK
ncbi:unnamed protein product [Phyllotreta striolata]|uniref:J domain-containing protein n=1 Tax=Phyllotreta striolata TaxID=444603 RepID=A0A9N9XUN3_PHYSR|nr:unnamed protein product [Phyllotreta striolata]